MMTVHVQRAPAVDDEGIFGEFRSWLGIEAIRDEDHVGGNEEFGTRDRDRFAAALRVGFTQRHVDEAAHDAIVGATGDLDAACASGFESHALNGDVARVRNFDERFIEDG